MTELVASYLIGIGKDIYRYLSHVYLKKGADARDPLGMSMLNWQMLYGEDQYRNPTRTFKLSEAVLDMGYDFGEC